MPTKDRKRKHSQKHTKIAVREPLHVSTVSADTPDTKKAKDSERKRAKRAFETPNTKEHRLAKDSDAKKAQRDVETPHKKEMRLSKALERDKAKRGAETPKTKELRLAKTLEREKAKLGTETPKTKERRLSKTLEREKAQLNAETPKTKERRLSKALEREKAKRDAETPKTKELRLSNALEREKAKLDAETPKTKERRLSKALEREKAKRDAETPKTKELRLSNALEREKAKLDAETPKTKELRLSNALEREKAKLDAETPKTKELRLSKTLEREKAKLDAETPKTKERRLSKALEREKAKLDAETPKTKELRLSNALEREKAKLDAETPKTKEVRLSKALARAKTRLEAESPSTKANRVNKALARDKLKLAHESTSSKKRRLAIKAATAQNEEAREKAKRARASLRVAESTPAKKRRLSNVASRKTMRKLESSGRYSAKLYSGADSSDNSSDGSFCGLTNVSDIKDAGVVSSPPFSPTVHVNSFNASLDAIYYGECFTCNERYFNMRMHTKIPNLCLRCQRVGNKFGSDNNMDPGDIPESFRQFNDLTMVEEMLISPVLPMMSLYRLPYGQYGYRGNIINFPQDVSGFLKSLPRQLDENQLIVVRRPGQNNTFKDFKVRRPKVLGALSWLVSNNPYFSDIEIDMASINSLPEDDFYQLSLKSMIDDDDGQVNTSSAATNEVDLDIDCDETTAGSFVPVLVNVDTEKDIIEKTVKLVTESDKDHVVLAPPLDTARPVDEFTTVGYVARAFPLLFPTGEADYNASRYKSVSVAEYYKHLMRYRDGRFAKHARFRYFALNTRMRWQAMNRGRFYVKQNPGDSKLTEDELKQMGPSERASLVSRMMRFSSSLHGSKRYFQTKRSELMAMIDDIGMPTVFFTLSSADMQWPHLRELLPGYRSNAVAVSQNPIVVDSFCFERAQMFIKQILMKELNGKDFWARIEYQHRGSLHVHGVLWMHGAPVVGDLSQYSTEKTAALIQYFDNLLTTWNPVLDNKGDGQLRPVPRENNPCAVKFSDVTDFEEDYVKLLHVCQRHTKCMEGYCLKKNVKSKKLECRFGFPKPLSTETELLRTLDEEDGSDGEVRFTLETKRNDPVLNSHNRTVLQVNRANCDVKAIMDKKRLVSYLVKYATKSEPRSESLVGLFKSLVDRMGPADSVKKLAQKVLLRSVGDRDYSAQETCHLLLELPLVNASRTFVHLNLSGNREFSKDGDDVTVANALDKYMKRPQNGGFQNMSLYDFTRHYRVANDGSVHSYRNPVIVVAHPFIPPDPDHPRHEEYCLNFLLKHKPFRTIADLTGVHSSPVEAYGAFLKYSGQTDDGCVEAEVVQAERNYRSEEQEPADSIDRHRDEMMDDWMYLCQLNPEFSPCSDTQDFDWTASAVEYDTEPFASFIADAKTSSTECSLPETSSYDLESLNSAQRRAYDLIRDHFQAVESGENRQPIRMIVSGRAGTGKSYLVHCLKKLLGNKCRLLAPTGVAAFLIGGETLHSSFQLPIGGAGKLVDLSGERLLALQERNAGAELFIIDEMSMVGRKVMGMLDKRIRQAFPSSSTEVLANKNFILMGDFGQLPPVADSPLYTSGHKSELADSGCAVYQQFDKVVVLEQIVRQQGDQVFRDILSRMRDGQNTADDYQIVSKRFRGLAHNEGDFAAAVHGYTTVEFVSQFNLDRLIAVGNPIVRINAKQSGSAKAAKAASDEAGGIASLVYLCKEARVMLTSNLWITRGLCNGTIGTVHDIIYEAAAPPMTPLCVLCIFPDYSGPSCLQDVNHCVPIVPVRRYFTIDGVSCSRENVPLSLAWSLTVHKMQGMTVPKLVLDIGTREFSAGLSYVGFSRVKSLDDLLLLPFSYDRLLKLGQGERFCERYAEDQKLRLIDGTCVAVPDLAVFAPIRHPVRNPDVPDIVFLKLINPNNWCYSNATVQSLLRCDELYESLRDASENTPVGEKLQQLLQMQRDDREIASTWDLRYSMDTVLGRTYYATSNQNDAFSFFEELVSCLPDEASRLFQLCKSQRSQCELCSHQIVTSEDVTGIVEFKHEGNVTINAATLTQCILNDWDESRYCCNCVKTTGHTVSNTYIITEASQYLAVCLPVFHDASTQVDYSVHGTKCRQLTLSGIKWKLVSMILHEGTLTQGHYRAWVYSSGHWCLISDDFLEKVQKCAPMVKHAQILIFAK